MPTVTAVGNSSGAVRTAFKTSYWSFGKRKLFTAERIPCKTGYLLTGDLTLLPELSFSF